MKGKGKRPESCECCHYDTKKLDSYTKPLSDRVYWFCDLCAGSMASQTVQYQHLFDYQLTVGVIMNAANHILAALNRVERQPKKGKRP
jgi:hypothetical protein